jgi:hypothetical protein
MTLIDTAASFVKGLIMNDAKMKDCIEKGFKWTVEFTVAESWVADGFDLDDERAHKMIAHMLQYAFNHEIEAKVIQSPKAKSIRKAQGA